MRIIVIGAGVIGITSAYELAQRGHQVTVIDANEEVASGASFANGGQLSFSYADPLASPGLIKRIPEILMGKDPGITMAFSRHLRWWLWNARMLRQGQLKHFHYALVSLTRLAMLSQTVINRMLQRIQLQTAISRTGKLVVFDSSEALRQYQQVVNLKNQIGCDVEVLDSASSCDLEPALEQWRGSMAGAVYSRSDATADSSRFVRELAEYGQCHHGLDIHLGKRVKGFVNGGNKVHSIFTEDSEYDADAIVIAAGSGSHHLASKLGIRTGISPIHGCSFTAPISSSAPQISVTHLASRMVFAPMGNKLRVAGFAHNGPLSRSREEKMHSDLEKRARELLPDAAEYQSIGHRWTGARPSRANSLPLISRASLDNVFLNTGHGSLGWTLSFGSARLLADLLERRIPELSAKPYQLKI